MTMHALISHIKDRVDIGAFNVSFEGRVIFVNSENEVNLPDYVLSLTQNRQPLYVTFLRTQGTAPFIFKGGEKVQIVCNISYGISITGKKGSRCPVNKTGIISEDKLHFDNYLQQKTGIKISYLHVVKYDDSRVSSKIIIKNNFNILLEGLVIDTDVASHLCQTSIGQKTSYGFGKANLVSI
jgi:hypothetical protein